MTYRKLFKSLNVQFDEFSQTENIYVMTMTGTWTLTLEILLPPSQYLLSKMTAILALYHVLVLSIFEFYLNGSIE